MSEAATSEPPTGSEPVVLLVDDTQTNLQVLFKTLSGRGLKLLIAKDGESAIEVARKAKPSLILLDIMMPGIDGYETCRRLKDDPETVESAIIFCSALDETADKVKGFQIGAVDYVSKPYEAAEVIARVDTHLTIHRLRQDLLEHNRELERQLNVSAQLVEDASVRVEGPLIGDSTIVKTLRAQLQACAEAQGAVLIEGPAGAGIEAAARTIHSASPRRGRAFIHVNCMGLGADGKDTLFGAQRSILRGGGKRPGKWDLAGGGSVFLDHVDVLAPTVQATLAKKLTGEGNADVRVIAYSSRSLDELTETGVLTDELARCLGTNHVRIPSLAERSDDIPALADHFIRKFAARLGKPIEGINKHSLKTLTRHPWPGDIEELQSVIECSVVAAQGTQVEIDPALFAGGGRVGSYRLLEKLGEGGMGEVWRAQHELLRRPAAVKLVAGRHASNVTQRDAAFKRFEREAHATASLCSPNTVQLFDYGLSEAGDIYYVMELLIGRDLDSMIKKHGPMPPERAIWLLRQACRSLGEAHAAGLVHRDIKPANLFATVLGPEYDFLKVLDFGIVKAADNPDDINLTGTEVMGSPGFMPPELVLGQSEIDGRADLYGLGCVGYWLLSGQTVFHADTPTAMCVQHATAEPRPVSLMTDAPIPPELEEALLCCLKKEPNDRPADANALWRLLGEIPHSQDWTQERAEDWWRLNEADSVTR